MRREFPPKVKLAAFQRANGHCENCTAMLMAGLDGIENRIDPGAAAEHAALRSQTASNANRSVAGVSGYQGFASTSGQVPSSVNDRNFSGCRAAKAAGYSFPY